MKHLSQKELNSFVKAINKDYGIVVSEKDAPIIANNLLDFVNNMIKFNIENDSKVLKSSKTTP